MCNGKLRGALLDSIDADIVAVTRCFIGAWFMHGIVNQKCNFRAEVIGLNSFQLASNQYLVLSQSVQLTSEGRRGCMRTDEVRLGTAHSSRSY